MPKLKVLIVGAGLGGLCLAQSLRRLDVDVNVFERDKSPWDRPQGYRLHLDSDGINALHDSLTPELYKLFDATSMKALPFTTIINPKLEILRRVEDDEHGGSQAHGANGLPHHVNVDRATVRQILLSGLDDVIHFGTALSHYEATPDGVTVTFKDGTSAEGDLLVGADGIRSTVRRQRLPNNDTQDAGVRAVYGRIPMPEAVKYVPAQALEDTFTVGLDAKGLFIGIGAVVFPTRPDIAGSQTTPKVTIRPADDYAVCLIGGRKELFCRHDDELAAMTSRELQTLSLELMKDWPENARAIPAHADPDAFFFVGMYTSIPSEVPASPNVTLLGDAIHAMTPTLGRGANVAMRDAALLGRLLKGVGGPEELPAALRAYELEMTSYGFDVVRKAAAMGHRLIGQNPISAPRTNSWLAVVNPML